MTSIDVAYSVSNTSWIASHLRLPLSLYAVVMVLVVVMPAMCRPRAVCSWSFNNICSCCCKPSWSIRGGVETYSFRRHLRHHRRYLRHLHHLLPGRFRVLIPNGPGLASGGLAPTPVTLALDSGLLWATGRRAVPAPAGGVFTTAGPVAVLTPGLKLWM